MSSAAAVSSLRSPTYHTKYTVQIQEIEKKNGRTKKFYFQIPLFKKLVINDSPSQYNREATN